MKGKSMSEQDSYQKLLEVTKNGPCKIDTHTLEALALLSLNGHDVNKISLPMVATIKDDDSGKIDKAATVYGRIGNIVTLAATPAQLLELMNMPEIVSIEASR